MELSIDKEVMRLGAVAVGVVGIVIIECMALSKGIDGAYLAAAVGAIAAAVGYISKNAK